MIQALTILHVIISILLVVVVLLQFGRGAEAGFFSDTSAQGVFAGPGPANILTRVTTFLAVVFLGLALVLANLRGKYRNVSIFDDEVPQVLKTTPGETAPTDTSTQATQDIREDLQKSVPSTPSKAIKKTSPKSAPGKAPKSSSK